MAYYVTLTGSKFLLKKENEELALNALKEMINANASSRPFFETLQKANISSLQKLLEYLGWIINSSSDSPSQDYNEIEFQNESYDHFTDSEILSAIAPFVEDGSYIEFHGEDGETWREVFAEGKVKTVRPKIIWE